MLAEHHLGPMLVHDVQAAGMNTHIPNQDIGHFWKGFGICHQWVDVGLNPFDESPQKRLAIAKSFVECGCGGTSSFGHVPHFDRVEPVLIEQIHSRIEDGGLKAYIRFSWQIGWPEINLTLLI